MKCLVLACGREECMWPLSRKSHSVFQETIARNIPYCDEFIIVTSYDCRSIVKEQMEAFRGTPYRCIYEQTPTGSYETIRLACVELQQSELVFAIPADIIITSDEASSGEDKCYKDAILEAKRCARQGSIVSFGSKQDNKALSMLLFRNDVFQQALANVKAESIEDSLLGSAERKCVVPVSFTWSVIDDVLSNEETVGSAPMWQSEVLDAMVKLQPAFKEALWGGTKLRDLYGMDCDYDVIAESWQMSAHPAGQSIVSSGRHKGLAFGDYLETVGKSVLGWKCAPLRNFPMLIKFIDARDNLSVQVHPDDDYALEYEDEYGKNEMWYVVDSDPGSGLYVGFNRDVTREEVRQRIADNTIMEVMNFFPTKPGDVYFIPAGTVHAIGAGNLICEIQQSSNSTYRLYDYGRVDKLGNPRQLHLEKALDVLGYEKYTPAVRQATPRDSGELLAQCKYFETIAYCVSGEQKLQLDCSTFHNVVCVQGSGMLTLGAYSLPIKAGESVFIPATDATLIVTGELSFVLSHI